MKEIVLIHYHEIGLKGRNRIFFEQKLAENLEKTFQDVSPRISISRISGRFIFELSEKFDFKKIRERLSKVFGIAYFAFAFSSPSRIEAVQEASFDLLRDKKFETFKIKTKRSDKTFPLTSKEINARIGAFILKKFPSKKVDLEKPEITCFVEICRDQSFIYLEKIKGPGGLPLGSSGKVLVLLSGGIDSPVASYLMMKRGCKVVFCHFHSYPQTSKVSIEKAREIVKKFIDYQFESKLFLVPFLDIQKEIVAKCPLFLRIVLYRRMMLRIAELLAIREKAQALVTGESIGQVASQTLENMRNISEATRLFTLRPLCGFDKEEIIQLAQKISTFEISIKPYEDCCSLFVPRRPATRAKIESILAAEKNLRIEKLIKEAIKNTKLELIKERE